MKRVFPTILLAVLLAITLAACGDDGSNGDDGDVAQDTAAPESESPPATQQPEEPEERDEPGEEESRCRKVPTAVVDAISTGLEVEGGGKLRGARAVRSDDFERAYFVSADIQGPGLEGSDDIATWTTNRLGEGGLIYAVGGLANEFSDWGDGGETDAGFSLEDDGAEESIECAKEAAG